MDPKSIRNILVPTDFSEPSELALDTAIAFARAFDAGITSIHVSAEAAYTMPPPIDVVTLPIDIAGIMAEVAKRLAGVQERVKAAGVVCEAVTLMGRADTEIVDYAEKNAMDLIVMGTHGRSGVRHALLGSAAEKVVQHTRCPVLVVPLRGEHPEG